MNDDRGSFIVMVLAGLLKESGGSITLTEQMLGEPSDRIIIETDEDVGIVTLTLIPDYVAVGPDVTPDEEVVKDDLTESLKGLRPPAHRPIGVVNKVEWTDRGFQLSATLKPP